MKLVTVQYPDTVDITTIPKGTGQITITDGTNSIAGGEIMAHTDMTDPEIVAHTHPAVIGPPA